MESKMFKLPLIKLSSHKSATSKSSNFRMNCFNEKSNENNSIFKISKTPKNTTNNPSFSTNNEDLEKSK